MGEEGGFRVWQALPSLGLVKCGQEWWDHMPHGDLKLLLLEATAPDGAPLNRTEVFIVGRIFIWMESLSVWPGLVMWLWGCAQQFLAGLGLVLLLLLVCSIFLLWLPTVSYLPLGLSLPSSLGAG